MKKTFIIALGLLFCVTQAQNILWQHKTGGKYADFLNDGIATLDYGFILAGASLSDIGKNTDTGNYDYMLTKYTENGDKEWTKTFNASQTDYLKQIIRCTDSGYLLGGISNSPNGNDKSVPNLGQFDIWLIKLDINGQIQWQRVLGGRGLDNINHIIRTNDGGYIIGGSSSSDTCEQQTTDPKIIPKQNSCFGNTDYWIVKLNAQGKSEWQKTFGGKYKDELQKIVQLPDGSFILAGNSNSPAGGNKTTPLQGNNDWWLLKLNSKGDTEWQKTFGDEADDKISAMLVTNDGNILVGGYFTYIDSNKHNNQADIIIRKIDTKGNLLWQQTFDNQADDILTGMLQNKDGSLILGAYTSLHHNKKTFAKGKEDFLLIKTDKQGNEKWRRSIGNRQKEVLKKLLETRDGGYVLMGSSMPAHSKGDTNADFLIVKIADKDKPIHPKLPLEAIPNPAINYTQAIIGKDYNEGLLEIFDLNGKLLYTRQLDGSRIIPVPVNNYPDGIYLMRVTADDMQNSVKIIKGR